MRARVGILGFAHGHVGAYCRRWLDHPAMGVEPVVGWDHDKDRLDTAVESYGIEACGSADELVGLSGLDAVAIGAETALHAEMVEKAAAAGRTIILQKPMALTLPEADRIVAAVEMSGVPFTMAWQMRADPQNLKIQELLQSGAMGRIFMVRRRHGLQVCLNPAFADTWHVSRRWNRDIWADDAAHPIDFVYWLFGLPESVTAEMESLYDPRMPMDNGVALFRYRGGPLVEVSCSFTNNACENTTEIIAENGSIVQNYGDAPSCNVPRPPDAPGLKWFIAEKGEWINAGIPTPSGHGERIANLAGPLAEFIRGERGPVADAREGRDALRMLLACYVSSREGRRVSPDDPGIDSV